VFGALIVLGSLVACGGAVERNAAGVAGEGGGTVTGAATGGVATAGSAAATGGVAATGGATLSGGGTPVGEGGAPGKASEGGGLSTGGMAGHASCEGAYLACGCGCCPEASLRTRADSCYYPELGDTLAQIAAQDTQSAMNCANTSCSRGTIHACCVSLPSEPDAGRYSGSNSGPDSGLIRIFKSESDGNCADFTLARFGPRSRNLSSRNLSWSGGGDYAACGPSARVSTALGVIGDARLQVIGDSCTVVLHLTAFYSSLEAGVRAVRFDVDGLNVGLAAYECPP